MTFLEAVQSCFRQYVGFGGRARRAEFWWWTFFTILAGIVLGLIDGAIFGWETTDSGPLGSAFSLATLLPGLAVAWRRLHDTGRSGWWLGGFYLGLVVLGVLFIGFFATTIDSTTSSDSALAMAGVLGIIFVLGVLIYALMLLYFFCQPSQAGDNKYGPNPIDGKIVDVFS